MLPATPALPVFLKSCGGFLLRGNHDQKGVSAFPLNSNCDGNNNFVNGDIPHALGMYRAWWGGSEGGTWRAR